LFLLRATPEHIYELNRREGLQLDAASVPDYVRFFFDNLAEPEAVIVERADELTWAPDIGEEPDLEELKTEAESLVRPLHVTSEGGVFRVEATGMSGAQLKEMELTIQPDGHLEVWNETILLEYVPVVEELL